MPMKSLLVLGVPRTASRFVCGHIVDTTPLRSWPKNEVWAYEPLCGQIPLTEDRAEHLPRPAKGIGKPKDVLKLTHFNESFTDEQYTLMRDFLLELTEGRLVKDVTNPFMQARFLKEHPHAFKTMLLVKHGWLGKYDVPGETLEEKNVVVQRIYEILRPLVDYVIHVPPGNRSLTTEPIDEALANLYPEGYK